MKAAELGVPQETPGVAVMTQGAAGMMDCGPQRGLAGRKSDALLMPRALENRDRSLCGSIDLPTTGTTFPLQESAEGVRPLQTQLMGRSQDNSVKKTLFSPLALHQRVSLNGKCYCY